jgi:hypothetical protein
MWPCDHPWLTSPPFPLDPHNFRHQRKRWSSGLVRTRLVCCSFTRFVADLHFTDGTIHIDTPFSHLLGKPPIIVASMTPTTVKASFVSAVLNAGYHVELAGGGHYNMATLVPTKSGGSKVRLSERHFPLMLRSRCWASGVFLPILMAS